MSPSKFPSPTRVTVADGLHDDQPSRLTWVKELERRVWPSIEEVKMGGAPEESQENKALAFRVGDPLTQDQRHARVLTLAVASAGLSRRRTQ